MPTHGLAGHECLDQDFRRPGDRAAAVFHFPNMSAIGKAQEPCHAFGAEAEGVTGRFEFFGRHCLIGHWRVLSPLQR